MKETLGDVAFYVNLALGVVDLGVNPVFVYKKVFHPRPVVSRFKRESYLLLSGVFINGLTGK